eukprot:7905735-Pyramimonas_sp.AAC.1
MDPTYRVTQVSLFPRVAPVGARRPTGAAVVALVDERALAMWHQHGPRLQGYISVTLHEAPSMGYTSVTLHEAPAFYGPKGERSGRKWGTGHRMKEGKGFWGVECILAVIDTGGP